MTETRDIEKRLIRLERTNEALTLIILIGLLITGFTIFKKPETGRFKTNAIQNETPAAQ